MVEDRSRRIPWIITHLLTNGVELQVCVLTMEETTDAHRNLVRKTFRATGVDALDFAGYKSITRTLDILNDKYGVHGWWKKTVSPMIYG